MQGSSRVRLFAAAVAISAVCMPLKAAEPGLEIPLSVDLWQPGDPGERLHVLGRVLSSDGRPIPNAEIFVRQADGAGEYLNRYQAQFRSGEDGGYRFSTVLPGQYYSNKHIHLVARHKAHQPISTEIRFKGDPDNPLTSLSEEAIDLEEGKLDGETVLFGRFDIVLMPLGG